MDKEERQRIYTLLSKFYPNAKQLKDRATLTAWGLALEDFPYEDVKKSVLDYATRNKYFPDLADITGSLAAENQTRKDPRGATVPQPGKMGVIDRKVREDQQALYERWCEESARLRKLRRDAGIPATYLEAKASGLSVSQWFALMSEKHLDNTIFDRGESQ